MEINSRRQICDVSPWIWFQSVHAETSYLKPEIGYGGGRGGEGRGGGVRESGEREIQKKKQRWREEKGRMKPTHLEERRQKESMTAQNNEIL